MTKTLAQFKRENADRLDREWNSKHPNGLGYIIQLKDGSVIWGVLTGRPTSATQRAKWKGTTSSRWSGWYVGKSFYAVKRHKTYTDLDEWAKDLTGLVGPAALVSTR